MRTCFRCNRALENGSWTCRACGATPPRIGSFLAFAPELVADTADYRDEAFDVLEPLQEGSFWYRARNRLIVDLARRFAERAGAIMEVGCGSGFVLSGLREAFPQATLVGSELHVHGLEYARRRLGDAATLVQMDARHIPFEGEFDLVCAFDVLEHLDEDEEVLAQMVKATRPGGHVMVTVPQHPALWSRADDYACHKRRYTRTELARKARVAGLNPVADTSFVSLLLPAMVLQRIGNARKPDYQITSEFQLPAWLNTSFERVLDVERKLVGAGISLPVGGSRVLVAQRPLTGSG